MSRLGSSNHRFKNICSDDFFFCLIIHDVYVVDWIRWYFAGEYSLESMLEMIALHLDATDSEHNTWKVLSSCFLTLYSYEEDCMSSCPMQTKNGHKQLGSFDKTPKIFTDGTSGKSWYLRCRWWITRHFSNSKLESEIESGIIISLEWSNSSNHVKWQWSYSISVYINFTRNIVACSLTIIVLFIVMLMSFLELSQVICSYSHAKQHVHRICMDASSAMLRRLILI